MKISVILPFRNERVNLGDALSSLRSQTHPEFEIIAVDNGSTDGSGAIARSYGVDALRCEGTLSDARLLGVTHSTGDVLFFVDADHVVAPRCVEHIATEFERSHGLTALVIPERSRNPHSLLGRAMSLERETTERAGRGVPRAYLRSRYLAVGGHSPNLLFGEDVSPTLRLFDAEIAMCQNALLEHKELRSARAIFEKYWRYGRDSANDRASTAAVRRRLRPLLVQMVANIGKSPGPGVVIVYIKLLKLIAFSLGRAARTLRRANPSPGC